MDAVDSFFRYRRPVPERLLAAGFTRGEGGFTKTFTLPSSGFLLTVRVASDGTVSTETTDPATGEPYVTHLEGVAGAFVGAVRADFEAVLSDVAATCFERDDFKSQQARMIATFARGRWGEELEFLWERFPGNAILRRQDTRKWYALLVRMDLKKLGGAKTGMGEIAVLRADPAAMGTLVDNTSRFPGWHMNKKNWLTLVLDGSLPDDEVTGFLEASRELAVK